MDMSLVLPILVGLCSVVAISLAVVSYARSVPKRYSGSIARLFWITIYLLWGVLALGAIEMGVFSVLLHVEPSTWIIWMFVGVLFINVVFLSGAAENVLGWLQRRISKK